MAFGKRAFSVGGVLAAIAMLACILFASCKPSVDNAGKIVVWANPTATTPVLPLYALKRTDMEFREWNSTMAFQSLLLSGDGEIWVGHLEGFARAYAHGAPLRLLAVTGWRKWQILSKRAKAEFPKDFQVDGIAFAPSEGAGLFLLKALLREQGVDMEVRPMEMRVALLKALDGRLDSLMLPEPFATTLMAKDAGFRRIGSLEEYYGRCRNRADEVPWAGIAVNSKWADSHPEEVDGILADIVENGSLLSGMKASDIAEFWPSEKAESTGISREAVASALEYDKVKVVAAEDMVEDIREFLQVIVPDAPMEEGMLWKRRH